MVSSSEYYVADNSDMENKKLEAAKNHYTTGNYSAALKLYLSLINTSISYKLYHRIAKCYYKMNDLENAEEYFLKSVSLSADANPSLYYLGLINYKKGNMRSAVSYWIKSYAYKPDDENICLNLATSYFSLGMHFQSVFYYEKYLKYAVTKNDSYNAIKTSIGEYRKLGLDFLQKAKQALAQKDKKGAIELLTFAVENLPTNFDINYLLGSVYLEENDNMHAMIYLKQALCIENKSMDVLQKLISAFINLGDYTAAYCMMRRLLPLVIHNQQEYLKTLQMIKELNETFDDYSYQGHKEWADNYYHENNYHLALLEYENCIFLKDNLQNQLSNIIDEVRRYIHPEQYIVKSNLEKGYKLYQEKMFKDANKYFSKVMLFADPTSQEYKQAKSRIQNV